MSETRRGALRILGTVTACCAFPLPSDELYGQHVHAVPGQVPAAGPYTPSFFTTAEYATLARLTDVIIPPGRTGGAAAAGVPEYIDRVVSLNKEHQPLARAGLAWLGAEARSRFAKEYLALEGAEHVALLTPLSDAVNRETSQAQQARYRTEGGGRTYFVALRAGPPPPAVPSGLDMSDARMPVAFFRLMKNLTADGYYTSRAGLLEELGYSGNTFLPAFPGCAIPEQ